ncbi:hypothetical protein FIBSPDRAFT_890534 [Athelia psychrophila]|uniref:Uncharacterized protein n=1 Tax=Athelia psychrophila TaxID=1759441 RepID=A0A166KR87_9AGAM|nr:hypothetical protein FIBSPDRAFT_890534 [Fibularhizoctonia sp. CBS 109695]
MNSDEHSEYALFVGAAEWTRNPKGQEEDDDLYVEVSVDCASQVLRTMYTKVAHWDECLKITGYLSSTVSIDIKSIARNSSESRSVARADTSLGNLLNTCADGAAAALELTIAPLMPDMREQVNVTDAGKDRKHFSADSMGIITVQLSRPPHNPPSPYQPSSVYAEPTTQMGNLEEVITAVEVPPPPQGSNVVSQDSSIQIGAAEWTRFVEVKVDGESKVHRTMYTKTAKWGEYFKMWAYSGA